MIHPSAIVHETAHLGEGVSIGAFAQVHEGVSIGANTSIAQGAILHSGTQLGKNNSIGTYSILGQAPQIRDYAKQGQEKLIIGDDNTIGDFCTLSLGSSKQDFTTSLGDANYLMANTHIGHDCELGSYNTLSNLSTLGGHVKLGSHSTLGGMAALHQFVQVGDFVMLGAKSLVVQEIPHFCLAVGERAGVKSLNLHALKQNFSSLEINGLKLAFKKLFRTNRALKAVAKEYQASQDSLEYRLCTFILNSKRGIPKSES